MELPTPADQAFSNTLIAARISTYLGKENLINLAQVNPFCRETAEDKLRKYPIRLVDRDLLRYSEMIRNGGKVHDYIHLQLLNLIIENGEERDEIGITISEMSGSVKKLKIEVTRDDNSSGIGNTVFPTCIELVISSGTVIVGAQVQKLREITRRILTSCPNLVKLSCEDVDPHGGAASILFEGLSQFPYMLGNISSLVLLKSSGNGISFREDIRIIRIPPMPKLQRLEILGQPMNIGTGAINVGLLHRVQLSEPTEGNYDNVYPNLEAIKIYPNPIPGFLPYQKELFSKHTEDFCVLRKIETPMARHLNEDLSFRTYIFQRFPNVTVNL